MPSLIILGNLNQFTFANSIISSNEKSKQLFGEVLDKIFVIHSRASKKRLDELEEWKEELIKEGIDLEEIHPKTLEVEADKNSILKFVDHIEFILRGVKKPEEVIIDLTNGTTVQKNLLSIVGYILDIKNQFMIDISKLFKLTENREFIQKELLLDSYSNAPDTTILDNIAYLNLSEVHRYKKIIDAHTENFLKVDKENSDETFFRDNLIQSIRLKLTGDQKKDNAIYRIAASSIASSIEELISQMIKKQIGDSDRKTLGQKIQMISQRIKKNHDKDFDLEFFQRFNEFMLYLRNSTTHKGKILSDIEKFKAELSVKMSFPYIDFYTDIVYPILSQNMNQSNQNRIQILDSSSNLGIEEFYYGLDGDDTGKLLEDMFVSAGEERKFRRISKSISTAITNISKKVKAKEKKKEAIIFEAGDDLLFKGKFSFQEIEDFQKVYKNETAGLTCSIGYGKSMHEVYLALKLAKSQPGKNSIVGIEIKNSAPNNG